MNAWALIWCRVGKGTAAHLRPGTGAHCSTGGPSGSSAQAPTQVPPLLPDAPCLLPVAAVSKLFVRHACPTLLKAFCLCVTILGQATQPFSVSAQ